MSDSAAASAPVILAHEPPFGLGARDVRPETRQAAAMRSDPRFAPLAEKSGLAAYWRESGHWPDFCANEPPAAATCVQLKAGP